MFNLFQMNEEIFLCNSIMIWFAPCSWCKWSKLWYTIRFTARNVQTESPNAVPGMQYSFPSNPGYSFCWYIELNCSFESDYSENQNLAPFSNAMVFIGQWMSMIFKLFCLNLPIVLFWIIFNVGAWKLGVRIHVESFIYSCLVLKCDDVLDCIMPLIKKYMHARNIEWRLSIIQICFDIVV